MKIRAIGDFMATDADMNDGENVEGQQIQPIDDEIGDKVKREIEMETETEANLMDLPFVAFDPVEGNEASGRDCATVSASLEESSGQKQNSRAFDKRFKCINCAFTSHKKGDLNRHQLVHDGIKPFKCEYCDYAARQKTHLIQHQRTHDRQKLLGVARDSKDGWFNCVCIVINASRDGVTSVLT